MKETFFSPLNTNQLIQALEKGVAPCSAAPDAERPRSIRIWVDGSVLRLEKPRFYGNIFAPFFIGTIGANENGSQIVGQFRMRRGILIFAGLWFGLLGLYAMNLSFHGLGTVSGSPERWFAFYPVGLALFGLLVVGLGRWLSRKEAKYLAAYIRVCCNPTN